MSRRDLGRLAVASGRCGRGISALPPKMSNWFTWGWTAGIARGGCGIGLKPGRRAVAGSGHHRAENASFHTCPHQGSLQRAFRARLRTRCRQICHVRNKAHSGSPIPPSWFLEELRIEEQKPQFRSVQRPCFPCSTAKPKCLRVISSL
jgi:hypothetical protein